MTSDSVIVRCPHCGTKNRIPTNRWGTPGAVCGKCKTALPSSGLFPDRPLEATDGSFGREVLDFQGAVFVEFFSPR